ncbi:hypothetical protein SK128_007555, partial [Halocaridina rubra]
MNFVDVTLLGLVPSQLSSASVGGEGAVHGVADGGTGGSSRMAVDRETCSPEVSAQPSWNSYFTPESSTAPPSAVSSVISSAAASVSDASE